MNPPKPYLEDGDLTLYHGDALTVLQGLPAGIAQTCVTSPPYWGLRDYGTGQWSGGDETCDHATGKTARNDGDRNGVDGFGGNQNREGHADMGTVLYKGVCGKCGAQRVDSQLGLEATPQQYVENMVNLFREVWRVLRDDGSLWLNLGDSYAGSWGNQGRSDERGGQRPVNGPMLQPLTDGRYPSNGAHTGTIPPGSDLKPKDLVGIPWRVAFALQADGWYLRSDIIWSKPNPMPESVTDRPTKAHEYLFLFSKQPRYFYDADAIREQHAPSTQDRAHLAKPASAKERTYGEGRTRHSPSENGVYLSNAAGRNRRSVWTIPTQPFPEAHFATYPEELVRPCILAGTSEKGECVECGAPWVRQVEREYLSGPSYQDGKGEELTKGRNRNMTRAGDGFSKLETTGWTPACSCLEQAIHDDPTPEQAAAWTRPQLVLDPFSGSGTTSLVARKHGRRSLGIDLSAEYLAIAAKRTQQLSLLGAP